MPHPADAPRGPTVKPVADVCRNALLPRYGDEARNEAVISLAMHRKGKPYQGRPHDTRGRSKRCLFRLAGWTNVAQPSAGIVFRF